MSVTPDRAALARFGLSANELTDVLRLALAGRDVGELHDGERAYEIVVRLPEATPETLGALDVPSRTGTRVPLSMVARVIAEEEPTRIVHDQLFRYVDVLFDAPSDRIFEAAKDHVAAQVQLPPDMSVTFAREGD
jgi:cobalt-zinc-cadmium resistance protein CzcA